MAKKLFGFPVNERMLGTFFLPLKILSNSRGQYTKGQIMCKVNIEMKHFISNNLGIRNGYPILMSIFFQYSLITHDSALVNS